MHVVVGRPAVIELLEPGYARLFDRAVEVFGADDRVRALWLSGSLGRGDADAMSDLDLLVAVADDELTSFHDTWPEWLAAITPTLIARPLPFAPGSLYAVTTERLRIDVVAEPASKVASSFFRHRLVVFDHDGLDAAVPEPNGLGPSLDRVNGLVEEFFRDYGMFPVVLERQDWLLGLEAIHIYRGMLYQLFVEMNAPLPPMGVKQWSTKLTIEQRSVLEALPTGNATRDGVVAAHGAAAQAFIAHARLAVETLGGQWPEELDAATRRYLRAHGIDTR